MTSPPEVTEVPPDPAPSAGSSHAEAAPTAGAWGPEIAWGRVAARGMVRVPADVAAQFRVWRRAREREGFPTCGRLRKLCAGKFSGGGRGGRFTAFRVGFALFKVHMDSLAPEVRG